MLLQSQHNPVKYVHLDWCRQILKLIILSNPLSFLNGYMYYSHFSDSLVASSDLLSSPLNAAPLYKDKGACKLHNIYDHLIPTMSTSTSCINKKAVLSGLGCQFDEAASVVVMPIKCEY